MQAYVGKAFMINCGVAHFDIVAQCENNIGDHLQLEKGIAK